MATLSAGSVGVDIDPRLDQTRQRFIQQARALGLQGGSATGEAFNRGFTPDLAGSLRAGQRTIGREGMRQGELFGDSFGNGMGDPSDDLTRRLRSGESDVRRAGMNQGDQFGDGFRQGIQDIDDDISNTVGAEGGGGKAKLAALAGGLAIAGVFADAFGDALEQSNSLAKLKAQLDLSAEDSGKAGKIAGSLFSHAYGDSMDDVSEAVRKTVTDIGLSFDDVNFEAITGKVMALSQAFDEDLGDVSQAVGQLMKSGMAKDATEALDIVAKGLSIATSGGDDLLDTLNEYPTQFRSLGIDGGTALGLIKQGLESAAHSTDIVADALKEFSLRSVDIGNKDVLAAYDALGMSAQRTAEAIAGGGPSAANALDQVLDKLRTLDPGLEKTTILTGLFGTQAEDMKAALDALDPSTAVDGLGNLAGAADRVNETLGATASATFTTFKRTAEQQLVTAIAAVLSGFEGTNAGATGFLGTMQDLGATVKSLSDFIMDNADALKIAAIAAGALWAAQKLVNLQMFLSEGIAVRATTAMTAFGVSTTGAATASTALASAMKLVLPLIAVGAGAAYLGDLIGKTEVATISTDKLSAAFLEQARTGKLGQAGLDQFSSGMGPFRSSAEDSTDALEKFGTQAYNALDKGWDARLGRWQNMGAYQGAFKKSVEATDGALAQLVSSGHADEATAEFIRFRDAGVKAGVPLVVMNKQFPLYTDAVAKAGAATQTAGGKAAGAAPGFESLGQKSGDAAEDVRTLKTKLDELLGRFRSVPEAQAAYEQAIDDLTGKIDKQTAAYVREHHKLDLSKQKSRDLQGVILKEIDATSTLSDAVMTQTGSSDAANRSWNRGIEALKKHLQKMGLSKKEAEDLAKKYGAIPDVVKTNFTAPGLKTAKSQAQELVDSVFKLNGVKLDVDVVSRNIEVNKKRIASGRGPTRNAAGGLIQGPGTETSDSIPALLSNNEYVIKASSANALGVAHLDYINKHGRLPGYAAGGHVQIDGYPEVAAGISRAQNSMASRLMGLAKKYGEMAGAFIGGAPGNVSGNAAILKQVAAGRGWGSGPQWNALYQLVQHESGFRNTAQNPTSSAYGMFQFLNGTWAGYGGSKTSNPALQSKYGLNYIAARYGSPAAAYSKWLSRSPHWYANGGTINEPVMGVGLRTGDRYGFGENGPEQVMNQQQLVKMRDQSTGETRVYNIDARSDDDRKVGRTIVRELQRSDMNATVTRYSRV